MEVHLPNGFTPRPYQAPAMAYFDHGGKRAVCVWHRRGGKDLTAMHQTCKMMHKRRGAYWHIFPTAEQGRKALWEGFTRDGVRTMEQVFPAAIRKSPRDWLPKAEMVVELKCGSIWRLLGSDQMEVVGAGPMGVVFSEYALAKPRTWDLMRPMLRENDGWMWAITTPRGKNHAWKLYEMARKEPGWFCDLKTLFDTRAYDPEQTIAEERASGMPEELIAQEYLCDWTAANVGSFYGASLAALEKAGRLGVAFEPEERDEVQTAWDIGRADSTSIWWFRPSRGGLDVLDHYSSHTEDPAHYFAVVDERGQRYGWRYRRHWLPHDARHKTAATKVSYLDQAREHFGGGMVQIVPDFSLRDGIAAVRWLLGKDNPATRFHARCSAVVGPKDCDGIDALKSYHREWDDEDKCFSEVPVHDWSSHTADAARYMATVARYAQEAMPKPPPPPPPPVARPIDKSFTLEELFTAREAEQRGRRAR